MPTLKIIGDPLVNEIFTGDIFGLILALPISLFLAYWICDIKNRAAVVTGAFVGALLGFLIILGWVGELIYNTPLSGANGGATFFGSVLICSVLGLVGGIITDLLIARKHSHDYRRQTAHES